MWTDEKLTSSTNNNPKFGFCCLQGSLDIPILNKIPNELYQLISAQNRSGKDLRTSIRLYNSILAFTSISANVDNSLMSAETEVYTYRINGAVHHKISSYSPNTNFKPQFSQIYIYDSEMQSQIRSGMFPNVINSDILNAFQNFLEKKKSIRPNLYATW